MCWKKYTALIIVDRKNDGLYGLKVSNVQYSSRQINMFNY